MVHSLICGIMLCSLPYVMSLPDTRTNTNIDNIVYCIFNKIIFRQRYFDSVSLHPHGVHYDVLRSGRHLGCSQVQEGFQPTFYRGVVLLALHLNNSGSRSFQVLYIHAAWHS